MTENMEDTIEQSAFRPEKILSHSDDRDSILRVFSWKSARGEDIQWAEVVKKTPIAASSDSAETIVGEQAEKRTRMR
jgi:hypothetical protein